MLITPKKMHLIPTLSNKSTVSHIFTNVKETGIEGRITYMGKKGSENAGKSQWHCYSLWGERVVWEQNCIVLDVLYLVGELAWRGTQIWAAADQMEERKMVWGGEGFGKEETRGEQRRAFALGAITHSGSGCTAKTVHWVVTGAWLARSPEKPVRVAPTQYLPTCIIHTQPFIHPLL